MQGLIPRIYPSPKTGSCGLNPRFPVATTITFVITQARFLIIATTPINITTSTMASHDMEKQPLLEPQTASEAEAQEPSLTELQQNVFAAQREYMKAWSRTTSGKLHRRIMYAVTAMLLLFAAFCIAVIVQDSIDDDYPPNFTGRVPLEAHIMSKCPDARDCLHDMILPAMQNVSRKVDFKLSYIGTYVASMRLSSSGEC